MNRNDVKIGQLYRKAFMSNWKFATRTEKGGYKDVQLVAIDDIVMVLDIIYNHLAAPKDEWLAKILHKQKVAYIPKRHIESKADYELIEE